MKLKPIIRILQSLQVSAKRSYKIKCNVHDVSDSVCVKNENQKEVPKLKENTGFRCMKSKVFS